LNVVTNNCPLCKSDSVSNFSNVNEKTYYRCNACSLIFLDEKFFLSGNEEKLRYASHNNDTNDERYIKHLSKLTDKLIPYLKQGNVGLDYGCGEGKPISFILGKDGYVVDNYDLFFYNDKELLKKKYDFITCTETAEHFHNPAEEFDLLDSMLKPDSRLAIMTNLYSNDIKFDEWWYHRDPTHVCFYSITTFKWIAKKYNWEILIYDSTDNIIIFKKS
jgi:cyclopropane fatty-acyl-phospholipid synthase-like methyltransferase